jgi:hypothetical protein
MAVVTSPLHSVTPSTGGPGVLGLLPGGDGLSTAPCREHPYDEREKTNYHAKTWAKKYNPLWVDRPVTLNSVGVFTPEVSARWGL